MYIFDVLEAWKKSTRHPGTKPEPTETGKCFIRGIESRKIYADKQSVQLINKLICYFETTA